jgi:hypothetical protein
MGHKRENKIMPPNKSNQQPQQQPQNIQPPANVRVEQTAPKPDKNVVVPKYDLLTEGYDPAKLKKRSS